MRGEQSRAAALFDVGDGAGDKNDDTDDDDVFVGVVVVVVGVGACANMYGRKPALQKKFCEAAVQRRERREVPNGPSKRFPSPLCFRVLKVFF